MSPGSTRTEVTYPTAWAAVADHLTALGVDTVFAIPSDDMALLAALDDRSTRVVLCRDQRNAVFMAMGYALATGRPGICAVGKGPAVTNTLTGLLEAREARVPLLLYATGTGAGKLGTGAFQELDQVAAVRPLAKWAVRVDDPDRACPTLDKAALVAAGGTPGPVYVELPEPIATAPVTRRVPWRPAPDPHPVPARAALADSYQLLCAARRPMLLVGGGARHRNRKRLIEQLAEALGAGIATTASGRGAADEDHPRFCGGSGLYAVPPLAGLWRDTDLVVALGSRLEETATFGWPDPAAVPVVQVILGESDVATERPGVVVLGDVAGTVTGWLDLLHTQPADPDPAWTARIRRARAAALAGAARAAHRPPARGVPVREVLAELDRAVPADRVLVQENGLQDMWSYFYPYWSCGTAGTAVAPSEQTSLGFGAAAAVGVACGAPERPVVALVGDGAFNLFGTELATVAGAGVAVLYVVLDNGGYGWLQANLDRAAGAAGSARRFGFLRPGPGGSAGARGYGLGFTRVDDAAQLAPALRQAWATCAAGATAVVEVAVDIQDVPPGMAELAGDFPAQPRDRVEEL